MGEEVVTVVVGGVKYRSWKSVDVRASMGTAARSFTLEAAAEIATPETAWLFQAGKAVEIYANDDLLLRGYVDRFRPTLHATKAGFTITGRSKSGDIVDSAALHPTGEFRRRTAAEIGAELARRYGVEVRTDQQLERGDYRLTPGETVFRAVERIVRPDGLSVMGEADGNVLITKAGSKRMAGGLVEGENVISIEADHNWANRFRRTIVRAQRPSDAGAENTEIEESEEDEGVDRERTTVVVAEDDLDRPRARRRARSRRDRSQGEALKATATVQGFRDAAGKVFEPNRLIWTESPYVLVVQDMLIETVNFKQSEGGSIATLGLVDPKARGGRGAGRNRSGRAWGGGGSDALSRRNNDAGVAPASGVA
jgi:prophage tail gpP-like protein